MLVLTRKAGQALIIAGNIEIRILDIEQGRVKIGIAAPIDVLILREEMLGREPTNDPGR